MNKQGVRALLPVLAALGTAAAVACLPWAARAEAWPEKPVSIVVPYSPGGTTDIIARIAAQYLGEAFGQSVIVDNRPGASGTIAMKAVAMARPDGYTLLSNEITQTVVQTLYPDLGFKPAEDLQGVSLIAETPVIVAVNPKVPATTLAELIAYAKANPGRLNFGSGGIGSGPHIAGELLKSVGGIDMTHIAYRGSGPAVADLIGGQIDVLISAAPTIAPHVVSGKLRALAVAGDKRVPMLPDVPTAVEAGVPDFVFSIWFGLAAPRGVPAAVLERIHGEVVTMLDKPQVRDKLLQSGAVPVGAGPGPFSQRIRSETEKWGALLKQAGVQNQ